MIQVGNNNVEMHASNYKGPHTGRAIGSKALHSNKTDKI